MEEQNDYINYPQTPWYEERQNWLFIGGGVLLIIVIVIGSMWFVRSRKAARLAAVQQQQLVQEVETQLETQISGCEGAPDEAACQKDAVIDSAVRARSVEMCGQLAVDTQEQCVTRVAVEVGEPEHCQMLPEANRFSCEDRVTLRLALDSENYNQCSRIQDGEIRETCEGQLFHAALQEQDCSQTHASEASCTEQSVLQEAIAAGDPSLCERLGEVLGEGGECEQSVLSSDRDEDGLVFEEELAAGTRFDQVDTDNDGLRDADEVSGSSDPLNADTDGDGLPDGEEVLLWGTDPTNADTDGDAFGDFEEVENGYNPLGEGRISEE